LCSVPVVIQQVRLRMKRQEKLFTLSTLQSILASASRLSFHNLITSLSTSMVWISSSYLDFQQQHPHTLADDGG
jgi:hypothetical protein